MDLWNFKTISLSSAQRTPRGQKFTKFSRNVKRTKHQTGVPASALMWFRYETQTKLRFLGSTAILGLARVVVDDETNRISTYCTFVPPIEDVIFLRLYIFSGRI